MENQAAKGGRFVRSAAVSQASRSNLNPLRLMLRAQPRSGRSSVATYAVKKFGGESTLFDSATGFPIVCGMADKPYRSLVKAISWRVTGSVDTMIITYLITRKWTFALAVSGVELFTKVGLYYMHERVWDKLSFGRVKSAAKDKPDFNI